MTGAVQLGYGGVGPRVGSGRLGKSISLFGYQRDTSSAQVQAEVPERTSALPSCLLVANSHGDTLGCFSVFLLSVYLDGFAEDNGLTFLLCHVRG